MFAINRILCKIVLDSKVLITMYHLVKILHRISIDVASTLYHKGYKNKNMKIHVLYLLQLSCELE